MLVHATFMNTIVLLAVNNSCLLHEFTMERFAHENKLQHCIVTVIYTDIVGFVNTIGHRGSSAKTRKTQGTG